MTEEEYQKMVYVSRPQLITQYTSRAKVEGQFVIIIVPFDEDGAESFFQDITKEQPND